MHVLLMWSLPRKGTCSCCSSCYGWGPLQLCGGSALYIMRTYAECVAFWPCQRSWARLITSWAETRCAGESWPCFGSVCPKVLEAPAGWACFAMLMSAACLTPQHSAPTAA